MDCHRGAGGHGCRLYHSRGSHIKQAMGEWGSFNSLFDLVAALFLSAWLLGWIIAPLIMTTILILMVFGREVLKAGPGLLKSFSEFPLSV